MQELKFKAKDTHYLKNQHQSLESTPTMQNCNGTNWRIASSSFDFEVWEAAWLGFTEGKPHFSVTKCTLKPSCLLQEWFVTLDKWSHPVSFRQLRMDVWSLCALSCMAQPRLSRPDLRITCTKTKLRIDYKHFAVDLSNFFKGGVGGLKWSGSG